MNERLRFALEQRLKYPQEHFIHQSVRIPEWVRLGNNVTIHENCTIGTEGFGFAQQEDGTWIHIPHVGGVVIGDDVEIFAGTNIDRGTVNDTVVGKGTKVDHHCHIGHNVQIGANCIITAKVIIGGSTRIGDNVWIGPNSTILDHITVGNGVCIGAQTNVISSVEDSVTVVGNPHRVLRKGRKDGGEGR